MRMGCRWLGVALVLTAAAPALGGLVVTTYRSVAQTNGYAPSFTQYYVEQRLEEVTPALAEVSGDWMGPNADGTPNTWHFVGTSRATSTTTITADSYTVEAAASFSYSLDTTADFVDPSSISIFSPAGAASYRGFFEIDVPAAYTITAQLNQHGRVRLNQIGGPEIFDESNSNPVPHNLSLAGTVPPGRYQFWAVAGLGLGNLFNGVHHIEHSGGFENVFFTVRIPEPEVLGIGAAVVAMMANRQWRCEPRN